MEQVDKLQSSLSIKKNELEQKNALANQKLKQMVSQLVVVSSSDVLALASSSIFFPSYLSILLFLPPFSFHPFPSYLLPHFYPPLPHFSTLPFPFLLPAYLLPLPSSLPLSPSSLPPPLPPPPLPPYLPLPPSLLSTSSPLLLPPSFLSPSLPLPSLPPSCLTPPPSFPLPLPPSLPPGQRPAGGREEESDVPGYPGAASYSDQAHQGEEGVCVAGLG